MDPVSIYEAKNNLSRLIDAALAGDQVILTKRGTPVVRIVPIEPHRATGSAIAASLRAMPPLPQPRSAEAIEAQIRESREMGE